MLALGSTYGGVMSLLAFFTLSAFIYTSFIDMYDGKNDILKRQTMFNDNVSSQEVNLTEYAFLPSIEVSLIRSIDEVDDNNDVIDKKQSKNKDYLHLDLQELKNYI